VISQPALAYTLSPPKTTSTLTGTLGFVTSGGGVAFRCDVRFTLRTHGPIKAGEISNAVVKGPTYCKSVGFVTTPWEVEVLNAKGGGIDGTGWSVGFESCSSGTAFTDNADGVWSFGPGCLSGTMISNPPITIVP
jgi:hypothetical protein